MKARYPATEVIMMSGQEDIEIVIETQRQEGIDFVRKPFHFHEILFAIERTRKYVHLLNKLKSDEDQKSLISRELETVVERDFIGASPVIKKVMDMAIKVPHDEDILILN